MKVVELLDRMRRDAIAHVRAGEHDEFLVGFLTASTLLELSNLSALDPHPEAYAQAAVEVIAQCTPIERCVLECVLAEAGAIIATSGPGADVSSGLLAPDADAAPAGARVVGEVRIEGRLSGALTGDEVPEPLQRAGLVQAAAEQVGIGLGRSLERWRVETERLARAEELARRADTDDLTGLWNRRRAQQVLEEACGDQTGAAGALAVALFDLDRFKSVNDALGHAVGDAVLVAFARVLADTAGDEAVVARWGGEEFLAVAVGERAAAMERIVEAVVDGCAQACADALPAGWTQSVSAGVVLLDMAPSSAADHVVRRADEALYRAKSTGRSRAEIIRGG